MPPPTVLKRRHSLRGKDLFPVIKELRGLEQPVKQFARYKINTPLEDMDKEEVINAVRELTGESEKDCLQTAGREMSDENLRTLLHLVILRANEFGQPAGQELAAENKESEPEEPPAKKGKSAPSVEKRLQELEKSQKNEEDKEIENVKEKVRSLALQSSPSIPLLLVSLDELARITRRKGHDEASVFDELSRQANLNQDKIDVPNFCLSVLGGKASDIVGKALSKAIKSKPETKPSETEKTPTQTQSPLLNLYGQPNYMGYIPPHCNFVPGSHGVGSQYGYRRYQRAPYRQPRTGCLFCGANDHYVRDCTKMKAARGKMNSQ
ncbi:uncharacterized protein LOC134236043 [Saccostrea cucullata]|uniref:uncharacterized protein LOC134236043 n=1 Tax=Saccostrea cuccullata TaxID=36930 RepID=UPI002ED44AFB